MSCVKILLNTGLYKLINAYAAIKIFHAKIKNLLKINGQTFVRKAV